MNRRLSQVRNSAENCSIDEWPETHTSVAKSDRLARLSSKRDPIGPLEFGALDVACVAGFATSSDPPALVYFWGKDLGLVNYASLREQVEILDLIRLAVMLGSISGSARPSLTAFQNAFDSQLSGLFHYDPDFLKDRRLYWMNQDDLLFVALYSVSGVPKAMSAMSIVEFIGFHNDYFRLKSPVWNSIPMSFLFGRAKKSPDLVAQLLLEPKCFNPFEQAPPQWFLWPWQRSLATSAGGNSVHYSPIETTSLVFDLRKSTVALEQLRDEDVGLFSGFIKDIVRAAKQAVFDQGGFFDKETGDGIVAHFCDFNLPKAHIEPASVRAFHAAAALTDSVSGACARFQGKLNMGVGGLGAAVGVHSAKAVWICEKNLVSAYGESAIMASRLCSEAELGSIFVSNHEFQKLASSLPADTVSRFERKTYCGKEYLERAKLYGYMLPV